MKKLYLLSLISLLMCGCTNTNNSPSILPSITNSETNVSIITPSETPSVIPSVVSPSVIPSVSPSPSVVSPSPSVTSPSITTSPSVNKEILPIGNVKQDPPNNINNKTDITDWVESDLFSSIPTNWKHIYGNNITNGNFYAESHKGGVRFDQLYKGLQSEAFTSFLKVELRFHFSSVNNCSEKPDKNAEYSFVIYGYDDNTNLIYESGISIDAITAKTAGNYVKHYITNADVSYFEIRLAAFPYKTNQCYNTGIDKISIKGWPYN